MKLNIRYIIIALLASVTWMGCNVINPAESTPTYIHIDSVRFKNLDPDNWGSPSTAINTVWVYYNNAPVGVFDLPATFPVIASGTGTIQVSPGIAVDGIQDNEAIYPFYTIDTSLTFTAQPGKILTDTPVVSYISTVHVHQYPFDVGTRPFIKFSGDTSVVIDTDPSRKFDASPTGYIYMQSPGDSTEDSSKAIALNTVSAYIELNYRCSVPFYVGLAATAGTYTTGAYYLAGINPSSTWKKIYISLDAFLSQYPGGNYNICIKSVLPTGQANGFVSLDNIKIIY